MIVTPIGATSKELDCDFGDRIVPSSVVAFVITVYPKTQVTRSLNEYHFIILLPDSPTMEYENVVMAVVEQVVESGDKYKMKELDDDAAEKYDRSVPVISYDPRVVENGVLAIFWLVPPKKTMC
jgi:hypothetical protein